MTSTDARDMAAQAEDINLMSIFLAHQQLSSLTPPITVHPTTSSPESNDIQKDTISPSTVVIAASAILHQAHVVFSFFRSHLPTTGSNPSSITTLVLTGGVGHSTIHLYNAIIRHPTYAALPSLIGLPNSDLTGFSEAELFHLIFVHFYAGERVSRDWNGGQGLKVLIEGESTNCGANASLSKALLERSGVRLGSRTASDGALVVDNVVIVQDPTMGLRTKASFEQVYANDVKGGRLRFWTWPTFVPRVKVDDLGMIVWDRDALGVVNVSGLWDMERFYGLILGEVPRLRDDADGYGPKGKRFIAQVDVSSDVEGAWKRLSETLRFQR